MTFEVFKRKVNALIRTAGGGINVWFWQDSDNGRYYAHFSDGTVISGNKICKRVAVKWNGGLHQSIAAI